MDPVLRVRLCFDVDSVLYICVFLLSACSSTLLSLSLFCLTHSLAPSLSHEHPHSLTLYSPPQVLYHGPLQGHHQLSAALNALVTSSNVPLSRFSLLLFLAPTHTHTRSLYLSFSLTPPTHSLSLSRCTVSEHDILYYSFHRQQSPKSSAHTREREGVRKGQREREKERGEGKRFFLPSSIKYTFTHTRFFHNKIFSNTPAPAQPHSYRCVDFVTSPSQNGISASAPAARVSTHEPLVERMGGSSVSASIMSFMSSKITEPCEGRAAVNVVGGCADAGWAGEHVWWKNE